MLPSPFPVKLCIFLIPMVRFSHSQGRAAGRAKAQAASSKRAGNSQRTEHSPALLFAGLLGSVDFGFAAQNCSYCITQLHSAQFFLLVHILDWHIWQLDQLVRVFLPLEATSRT
ncbi:hypothetical protein B0T25DRAFT_208717 [Lasiosphaeria hispida]|uniref:Uncharacterized protein n=1 Tax=Lasiosphaeria hispida TaxID=260671 RepID=A0AAJ0HJ63_9PEZI|nr:hypothetical protein B0T25DRAFT_208717 [Lasiosphaeria hispida]